MSSGLTQLRLLLWRDLLKRRRKPVTLFLEIIWPIVLFSIVILVRNGALPDKVPTCKFKPWVMPSQGGVEFLQSFVCNLDNSCRDNLTFLADGQVDDARAQEMKANIKDLMSNSTGRIVQLLPKTSGVVGSVSVILEEPGIKEFINAEMKVRDALRHPDTVGYEMENTLGVVSRETAAALLNAKIRTANLPLAGGNLVDLKELMCTPELFKQHFSLPAGYKITTDELSQTLCNIPEDKITRMTEIMQQQTNTTKVIQFAKEQMGQINLSGDQILDGLLGMLDLLANLDNLGQLAGTQYQGLTHLLQGLRYSRESVQELNSAASELLGIIDFIKKDGVDVSVWLTQPDKWNQLMRGADALSKLMDVFTLVNVQFDEVKFGQILGASNTYTQFFKSYGLDDDTINTLTDINVNASQYLKVQDMLVKRPDSEVFCKTAKLSSIFLPTNTEQKDAVNTLNSAVCSSDRPADVGTYLFSTTPEVIKSSMKAVGYVSGNQSYIDLATKSFRNDFVPFLTTVKSVSGFIPGGTGNNVNNVLNILGRRKRSLADGKGASWSIPQLLDSIRGMLGQQNGQGAAEVSNFIKKILSPTSSFDQPVFVVLRDVLVNSDTFGEFLAGTFKATPEFSKALLNSAINLNLLTGLLGGQGDILNIVCNPLALAAFLQFSPSTDINQMSFKLCYSSNTNDLLKFIVNNIDTGFLVNTFIIPKLPKEILSEEWWDQHTKDLDVVLSAISSGVDIMNAITYIQHNDLQSAINTIIKVVNKNVDHSGNSGSLLNALESTFGNSVTASRFVIGLTSLAKTIINMDVFRPKITFSGVVSDFIINIDLVTSQLYKEIGLPYDMAWALMDANFTFVYKLSLADLSVASVQCNSVYLSTILQLEKGLNNTWVFEELCTMNEALIYNVTELILRDIKLGEFLVQYIRVSPSVILKQQNMTNDELQELMTLIGPATNSLSSLSSQISDPDFRNDSSNPDRGVLDTVETATRAFCGRVIKFNGGDASQTSAYFDPKDNFDKSKDTGVYPHTIFGKEAARKFATFKWSKLHMDEMSEFGNDEFCKDVYRYIQSTVSSGAIIWMAVKPILRGRILYTPDTPITKLIMTETINFLDGVKYLHESAKAWDEAVLAFMKLGNTTSGSSGSQGISAPGLSDALRTSILNSAAYSMFGVDGETLANRLDSGEALGLSQQDLQNAHNILELVYNASACISLGVEAYPTLPEMEKRMAELQVTNTLLGGVIFDKFLPENVTSKLKKRDVQKNYMLQMPPDFKYTIRLDPDAAQGGLGPFLNGPDPRASFIDNMKHMRGFTLMQDLIDNGILQAFGVKKLNIPKVSMHQVPAPCWTSDLYSYYGGFIVAIIMVFVWLCMMAVAIVNLVTDKETGIGMSMQVMGLNRTIAWWSWFISSMGGMAIMSAMVSIFLKLGSLFRLSDIIVVFIFLLLYSFSVLMLCYLVGVFFKKTTMAALVGLLIYLLSCLPYIIGYNMEFSFILSIPAKIAICLFTVSAFMTACQDIVYEEQLAAGIQWDNMTFRISGSFTFMYAVAMIVVDGVLYGLIAWYIENLWPGQHETGKPFYFFLMPSYWGYGKKEDMLKRLHFTSFNSNDLDDDVPFVHGEPDPDLPIGISLHKILKIYKKGKPAVDNFSINFFQNQVTAFLGHNGAGKTSTIHMLTGVFEPTSGKAYVNGRNILTDMQEIRKSMGFCPQYDILYDFMTVEEHLDFYLRLKSKKITPEECKKEKEHLLQLMALERSAKQKAIHLSGGQKRRLSVGIAFAGGSKVVILDEPTSGVDPAARRNIWDIVVANTEGRTIILSTHHLDEAEIIGDRIVMIHQGKTVCKGSPMFLKNYYASGYHLTVAKAVLGQQKAHVLADYDEKFSDKLKTESLCKSSELLTFIQRIIPGARLVEEIGTEMTFILPTDNDYVVKMKKLFVELDANMAKLHIHTYGLSDTTLEEIFLKVTQAAEAGMPLDPGSLKHWTMMHAGEDKDTHSISESSALMSDATTLNKPPLSSSRASTADTIYSEPDSIAGSEEPVLPSHSESGPDKAQRSNSLSGSSRITGSRLKMIQFQALIIKRFHHYMRSKRTYMAQVVFPVLFVLIAMACTRMRPGSGGKAGPFIPRHTMYSPLDNMFVRLENRTKMNELIYEQLRTGLIGTGCMPTSEVKDLCNKVATDDFAPVYVPPEVRELWDNPPHCHCNKDYITCPAGAEGRPAPRKSLNTGDTLDDYSDIDMDIEDYMLRSTYHFPFQEYGVRKGRFGGWTLSKTEDGRDATTVWFNNRATQAIPAFYNAYSNFVLRAHLRQNGVSADMLQNYGITAVNWPLPSPPNRPNLGALLQTMADAGIALILMAALCFVPPGFTNYLINERVNKEKRLQFICGVGTILYWFTAFLWDFLSYCLTVGLVIGVTYLFNVPMYTSHMNLVAFASVLLLFGWSCIPLDYLLSRFFKDASVSYMVLFLINLFIGINCTASMLFFNLPIFKDATMIRITQAILEKTFLVFPQYCLGDALLRLSSNQLLSEVMARFGLNGYKDPFGSDMLLWHIIVMGAEGCIFFCVLLFLEARLFVITDPKGTGKSVDYREDSDVSRERQRVVTGEAKDDVLVLYNITKEFRRGFLKVKAVDNLCLGIPKGECFGLLGINGAGKTTTFKMITGDIQPSSGAALLNGKIISEDEGNMDQNVGYCPQYDALDEMLTGREMLYFYGRLKGIQNSELQECCEAATNQLGLKPHIDKRTINLSAGNKRKLSAAVSVLGNPALVLMDEPTTGMDPGTRRLVWDNIIKVVKDNRSIILTSHSMAECDALCTRMAIMVNGQFMCLGSGQHLKNKFGSGYTVMVRVAGDPPDVDGFKVYMSSKFPRAKLKDHHLRQLEYEVPLKSAPLSELFAAFEDQKQKGLLEDFSVSQTTLDQVFLHFARQQGDGRVVGDEEDDMEDDRRSIISHVSRMTTRSNDTIHSLFSVVSGKRTIRRRGRFQVEDHYSLPEPSINDKVEFSMEDWSYTLPDNLLDDIKEAPDKAYLRQTLSNQLPPQLRHAPAAVLNRYLGPEVRNELHEKRRQFKQNQGPSRHGGANARATIARRARHNRSYSNRSTGNVVVEAGIEEPPAYSVDVPSTPPADHDDHDEPPPLPPRPDDLA